MDITVVGTHKFAGKPERGTLSLSAGFESDAKDEAMRTTTALVNQLHDEFQTLKAAHPSPVTWFAVLPIRTRSWRPYNDKGKIVPMRYAAAASLRVKFRDFKALAQFGGEIGGRSGVTLEGVEWTLTEATKARVEAEVLAGAVKRARERALVMAKAGGAGDVVAVEIADPGLMRDVVSSVDGGYGGATARTASSSGSEDIQLVPEDVVVSATVHARFKATLSAVGDGRLAR